MTSWLPPLPTGARRRTTPLQRALLAATAIVLVVLVLAASAVQTAGERQQIRETLATSDEVARRVAVAVGEALDEVDQCTLLVQAMSDQNLDLPLRRFGDALRPVLSVTRSLYRTDERGLVTDSSALDVPLSIGDEDDFKAHARTDDRGLVLRLPVVDVLRGGAVLPASRRLAHRDGSFAGVVVAMLEPAALLRSVPLNQPVDAVVGVLDANGVFVARLNNGQVQSGQQAPLQRVLWGAAHSHDTLRPVPSSVDGVARFVSTAPVDNYPYHVVVATPASQVEALHSEMRRTIWGVVGAVALLVLCGAAALWRLAGLSELSRLRAKKAESLYRATSEGSLDALFMLRLEWRGTQQLPDFVIAQVNGRGARLLGDSVPDLIGRTLNERLPFLADAGLLDAFKAVAMTGQGFETEVEVPDRQLPARWLHLQAVAIEDGLALITRDVSEQHAARQRLHALARVDALTGLANRLDSEDQLKRAVARANRSGGALSLVFLDLDGFKEVNDTFGHDAGDTVLVEVARRLRSVLRSSDHISRLGGDEFLVIIEDSGEPQDRLHQCERMLEILSQPHTINGHALFITPSVGLALYHPGESADAFRRRADAAMYDAKRAGKACLRVASPDAP